MPTLTDRRLVPGTSPAMDALLQPSAPDVPLGGGGPAPPLPPEAPPHASPGFLAPAAGATPIDDGGKAAPSPGLKPMTLGAGSPIDTGGVMLPSGGAPPIGLGGGGPAPPTDGGGQPIDDGGVMVPDGGGTPIDDGGKLAPTDGGGGGTPGAKETPAMQALRAKDAAFARAKDSIGQTMRASMTSLRENLAGRGALGGGLEAAGTADVIGQGANTLSDVVTNQADYDVAGQNQSANQRYQGALTKRGQDLGVTQSILSLLGSQAY